MARRFTFRIDEEGVGELRAKLESLGPAGAQAFNNIRQASPALADALQKAETGVDRAKVKILDLAKTTNEASARMIAGMSAVNDASQRLIAGMSQAGQAASAMNVAFANANRAAIAGVGGFRSFGAGIQQAGFQVGDFAVQVASGQNAMRALIQQGTQLLSFFGPWGAVIGAAGAVVGALVTQIDLFGDSADDAAKDQEKLNARLEQLSGIMDKLHGKAEPTRAALEASRRNIVSIAASELRQAEAALAAARGRGLASADEQGAFVTGAAEAADAGLEKQTAEVKRLRAELTLLRAEAGEFGDRFSVSADDAAAALKYVTEEERKAREEAERLAKAAAETAEREAERRARAREAIDKQIRGLAAEAAALKESDREHAIAIELHKAEETARAANIKLTEEQAAKIRELTGAKFDEAEADRARERAERERVQAQEKAEREAAAAAERAARESERPFIQAAENIQQAFGDLWTDIFTDPIGKAEELSEALKRIFARLAGEITSAMIITPILDTAGLTGASSSRGGGSIGLNLSSFASGLPGFFSGGASGTGFRGPIGASGNPTHTGASGPAGASTRGGGSGFSFLGAGLGVLASLGDIINGIGASGPGATYGQLGSGIGGAIGSIAGSFFGPLGGVLGQMLGSTLGGLVGGFISGPNNYPKAAAYLQSQGGRLVGAGYQTANDAGQEYIDAATGLRDTAAAQINALAAVLGGAFGQGELGYFGPGGIGGIQAKAGTFNTVVGTGSGYKAESFGKDQQAALENYVVEVISQSVRQGLLSGLGEGVKKALAGDTDYDTLAQLTEDINLGRLADGLGLLTESSLAFQAEMLQLQEKFAATQERAAELGFVIGDKLQERFETLKEATEEKYFGAFRNFARELTQGPLSTLSPEQKFFESRSAYVDIERRALAGDALAQSQFIGAAQTYLGLARQQFASTSSYDAIYQQVLAATQKLGTAPSVDMAPVVNAVTTSGAAIVKELAAVRSAVDNLAREQSLERARRRANGR